MAVSDGPDGPDDPVSTPSQVEVVVYTLLELATPAIKAELCQII